MVIDHIGIAVKSLPEAIEYWSTVFGYRQSTEIIVNTRQKVKVTFLTKVGSLSIKLFEPTDSTSSAYAFAHRGGGLHHLCFRCQNLEDEISRLVPLGLRVLVAPQPGEAFDNENIAFLFANQGLNIELIDTGKRAGLFDVAIGTNLESCCDVPDLHPDCPEKEPIHDKNNKGLRQ